jgi:hypothetical protein
MDSLGCCLARPSLSNEAQFESEVELFHVNDPPLLEMYRLYSVKLSIIETVRVPGNIFQYWIPEKY